LLDQATLVLDDQAFDRGGEVLPEVDAVGDLHRAGCPGPGALGIGTRPVPADHL